MQYPTKSNVKPSGGKSSQPETASVSEGHEIVDDVHLRREFKERHISMIAVAGAIGTGFIIGSGTGLVRGGPASLLIAYCVVGAIVFFIMTALGEMATFLPMDKGFAGYATRFVDPALGYVSSICIYDLGLVTRMLTIKNRFATGWNYFFKYAIVLPNNLTAAGIIIQYWRPDLNVGIFVATFTVAIIAVNVSRSRDVIWSYHFTLLILVLIFIPHNRFFTCRSSERQSSGYL